jgi:ketosteroid isomerase-like protein
MSIAWDEALNTKDLETLTMLYASDARILPPNGKMLSGAEGVRETFGAMMDAGLTGKTSIVEISMSGGLAHKIGTYQVMDGDSVVDTGKFIETWRMGDDGKWRISNDIWNSDNPPAPPLSTGSRHGGARTAATTCSGPTAPRTYIRSRVRTTRTSRVWSSR